MEFTHQAFKRGQVPVLLVMDTMHYRGGNKAFLHDTTYSAHPEEQEYLLGRASWQVTKIAGML